jgi:hypothetical protein
VRSVGIARPPDGVGIADVTGLSPTELGILVNTGFRVSVPDGARVVVGAGVGGGVVVSLVARCGRTRDEPRGGVGDESRTKKASHAVSTPRSLGTNATTGYRAADDRPAVREPGTAPVPVIPLNFKGRAPRGARSLGAGSLRRKAC